MKAKEDVLLSPSPSLVLLSGSFLWSHLQIKIKPHQERAPLRLRAELALTLFEVFKAALKQIL